MTDKISERIPSAERREQILGAAGRVFGERGYFGATTDQIAKAAGISQPYVVRMFGGKENLFVEVLGRALDTLLVAFTETIGEWNAQGRPTGAHEGERKEISRRLGLTYVNLIEDRGILLSLMQAFGMGHDPVIGGKARAGFIAIYRMLREDAGFEADEARSFLAEGMLLNTLLGLRLPDEYGDDPCATELLESTFRTKLQLVLDTTGADA
ncbi:MULTISPECIES: TetR/AcrR family transcriptional regulator [unclassified Leifsonia]|uniref:TetR/AcrR family transcriptional regulator n=1 Tax=unclassified Leifsonia TaxID=2663824 RepID=UPI00092B58A9|nr:TetR/AcrR family transcriptional regulator [Leifsonia sp. 71-9]OJX74893.1 MAG: TetR family transcriptional regulator [Leifsonia sp. 71-9]